MGFFAGFVNQLNIQDEARARKQEAEAGRAFTAEQAELDREQRRQELADALRQRRQEAVVAAAASRGIVIGGTTTGTGATGSAATTTTTTGAGTGGGGGTTAATTSAGTTATTPTKTTEGGMSEDTGSTVNPAAVGGHFANIILEDFGADPNKLAPFAALGEDSMSEIFDAIETVRVTYVDAGRATEFTPEVVNNILDGVRVTVRQGGTVQWEDLAEMAGLSDITDEEKNWINLSLGGGGTSVRTTILETQPEFPLPMEDITRFKDAASADLVTQLESLQIMLDNKSRAGTITPEEATTASDVSRAISTITENEGTVPNWVISQFGSLAISPYLQNEPRLMRGNLGGAWDIARQRVFGTEEDVSNALDAGTVNYGDTVVVGGRTYILNR